MTDEDALTPNGDVAQPRRPRVLVAVSGSVATIKLPLLAQLLCPHAEVKIVATDRALHFLDNAALPAEALPVLTDSDEWSSAWRLGDPVLHIELRKWADAMVVAPLSANTLAKLAAGLCDNLLTSVVRAWDFAKPLLVAPAMNTLMWGSPFTGRHLDVLRGLAPTVQVVPPTSKRLACGDVGEGAMASVQDIYHAIAGALKPHSYLLPPLEPQAVPPAAGQLPHTGTAQAPGGEAVAGGGRSSPVLAAPCEAGARELPAGSV